MGNGNTTTTRRTGASGTPTPTHAAVFRVYFQRVPGTEVAEATRSVGAQDFTFHGSAYTADVAGRLTARGSLEAYECENMRLTIFGEPFEVILQNQSLQPIDTVAGLKQRLQILGYYLNTGATIEDDLEAENSDLQVKDNEFEIALLNFACDAGFLDGRAPAVEINQRLKDALQTAVTNSWPSHT